MDGCPLIKKNKKFIRVEWSLFDHLSGFLGSEKNMGRDK